MEVYKGLSKNNIIEINCLTQPHSLDGPVAQLVSVCLMNPRSLGFSPAETKDVYPKNRSLLSRSEEISLKGLTSFFVYYLFLVFQNLYSFFSNSLLLFSLTFMFPFFLIHYLHSIIKKSNYVGSSYE